MSAGSREWLEFAKMDLGAAEYLLTMYPLPAEIICYHCEQAVEKFLKAALVQFGREPPKTHNLLQLCNLCCEVDKQFVQLEDICCDVMPYGVQVRYPSNLDLDEEDAASAVNVCKYVRDFVCQELGYEMTGNEDQGIELTMG